MNILSFNDAKREDLLRKSEGSRGKRQLRQAYDYLREALRYGENAVIFHRAAVLLNELGEHAGALQVAENALRLEPQYHGARWEQTLALERTGNIAAALEGLETLRKVYHDAAAGDSHLPPLEKLNETWAMCLLKKLDASAYHRFLFRHANEGKLSDVHYARWNRLNRWLGDIDHRNPNLVDWLWIIHRRHLLHRRDVEWTISNHQDPTELRSCEHYGMAHPTYGECGKILLSLKNWVKRRNPGYTAVCAYSTLSTGVARAVAEVLNLPYLQGSPPAKQDSILCCLTSNRHVSTSDGLDSQWKNADFFLMTRHFDMREFYDVVSPEQQKPLARSWAQEIDFPGRQLIGVLGEWISLPWEDSPLKHPGKKPDSPLSPSITDSSIQRFIQTDLRTQEVVARELLSAYHAVRD